MPGRGTRPLNLLPRSAVQATSAVDHPDWNYRPVLGSLQRIRFRVLLELLAGARYGRLLEIGYGSGVFLPALAEHCSDLYGIDPHERSDAVAASLARHGVPAVLARGTAESLPYADASMDCVVAVSSLEYVLGIDTACREIRRVLAPGGTLAVVTPGATRLWNVALRVATREGPSQYGDRRQRLQPALRGHFRVAQEISVPRVGGAAVRLYTGLRLHRV